jgi:DNA-binding MarR family transcriptional regulator
LVRKGYCARGRHPSDARARLITLTERGWACTRAADDATARLVASWSEVLGEATVAGLRDALAAVVPAGRLRPATW